MSFCSINIFLHFDLLGSISMKVQFIRKVHNKIQIDKNIETRQTTRYKTINYNTRLWNYNLE
jgi:hypothetical protein